MLNSEFVHFMRTTFNPFRPNGIFHYYQLDQSIFDSTDHPDLNIAVDWDIKHQTKQKTYFCWKDLKRNYTINDLILIK